jgi:hypothetical protein
MKKAFSFLSFLLALVRHFDHTYGSVVGHLIIYSFGAKQSRRQDPTPPKPSNERPSKRGNAHK